MIKYKIEVTDSAISDMKSIYDYIALKLLSPQTAMEQYDRIVEAIMSLDMLPERNNIFECEPEHSRGIRKLPVDNYLICYVISNKNKVVVTDILYGASDIHRTLEERH